MKSLAACPRPSRASPLGGRTGRRSGSPHTRASSRGSVKSGCVKSGSVKSGFATPLPRPMSRRPVRMRVLVLAVIDPDAAAVVLLLECHLGLLLLLAHGDYQGSILLDRCTGKTWLLLCIRNDTAGCAFRWAPIPDATEPAGGQ